MMLDGITWGTRPITVNGFDFVLEEAHEGNCAYAADCFKLFKNVRTLEQYGRFWKSKLGFQPKTILELGMWDGGSVALWFEYFQPDKLAALDNDARTDSPYLQRYIEDRGLQLRIKTFWSTDQAQLLDVVKPRRETPKGLLTTEAHGVFVGVLVGPGV